MIDPDFFRESSESASWVTKTFVETQTEELEAHSCTEYFKIFKTSWGMQRHFSWKQNNKDLHAFDYKAILWNVQFLLNALRRRGVVDYRATWNTFQPKIEKQKKSTLKKVLIFFHKKCFLIFWEMEISSPKLKKISHIFPKKIFSYISGGHFSKSKIKKNHFEKISYISSIISFLIFLAPGL